MGDSVQHNTSHGIGTTRPLAVLSTADVMLASHGLCEVTYCGVHYNDNESDHRAI
jgi:hypothetical protein